MIPRFNYDKNCWWCGDVADSAEHKYKKSDLLSEFGKGPYNKKNGEVVRVYKGQLRKVLGPNSQEVKFSNSLCESCNNVRSQPFDLAYSVFVKYLRDHEEQIYSTKQVQLSKIFGSDWQIAQNNVLRYYVKHICCRLALSGILIKDELTSFLNGNMELKFISLYMEVRKDIVSYIKRVEANGINSGSLWLGDLCVILNNKTLYVRDVRSFHGYRWLRTNYIYDDKIYTLDTNFCNDIVVFL